MATPADIGAALLKLQTAFDCPPDRLKVHRIASYEKGLEPLPGPLLLAAADRAAEIYTAPYRGWLPSVRQIKEAARDCRHELLKAHPYDGCCECEDSKGWRAREIDGVTRMEHCPCRKRHQQKLASMGVSSEPLALPAPEAQTGDRE